MAQCDYRIAMRIVAEKRLQFMNALGTGEVVEFVSVMLRIDESVDTEPWREYKVVIARAADRH